MKLQHHRPSSTAPRSNEVGATLVEWVGLTLVVAVILVAAVMVASGKSHEKTQSGEFSSRPPAVREVTDVATYKMLYQGKKWLYCVTGYQGQIMVIESCDYGRFYRDHPELGNKPG